MRKLLHVRGDTDVHYCVIPQDRDSPVTLCGVDCGEFSATYDGVNCPDCVDLYDDVPTGITDVGFDIRAGIGTRANVS